jgi:hypothetical protein
MKIAVTVCDCSHVVHAGGEPHRVTSIIELTGDQVPPILANHLELARSIREKDGFGGGYLCESVTFSLVEEPPTAQQYAVLPKALSAEAIAKMPVDLAEAVEQCKLAIIRHRADDWHEIEAAAMQDVFRALAEYAGSGQ